MKVLIAAAAVAMLASGCASQITAPSAGGIVQISKNSTVGEDLLAMGYNLDNAVIVGALPSDDPAPACVHDVLRKAGLETVPGTETPKSFTPQREGVLSEGAIIYIKAQALKSLKGIEVSPECEQIIGRIVVDNMKAARKVGPFLF